MDLNIVGFGYLFLRLAPFVLASFFTLASIFNQDFKGFIYLVGLLFSSFITMLTAKLPVINKLRRPEDSPEICNVLTIGQTDSLSDLPLGQSALTYTFAYLLFSILKYEMVLQNIPTLVFFPLLIIFDFIWNLNNSCYSFSQLLTSLCVGGIIGISWASIIATSKTPSLMYFSSLSSKEVCSKPSKSTFRCNVYKNGKLISKNVGG
tara:strand:+ start:318 stop:935 length:618 start_codon:yes stop_codon:yes gene_type:complete